MLWKNLLKKNTYRNHYKPIKNNSKKLLPFELAKTVFLLHTKKKFSFAKSITDKDGSIQINIPPGANELESSNDEIKKHIIKEG